MLNNDRPRKAVTWTPEMDAALVDLRAQYVGKMRCADAIGVCKQVLEKRMDALGLPRFRPGRPWHRSAEK